VLTDIYGGVQRADATAEIFFTVFLALALTDDSFFRFFHRAVHFCLRNIIFAPPSRAFLAMVVIYKVMNSLSDFLTTYGRSIMRIRDSRR